MRIKSYLIAAIIVWVAIIIATAALLKNTAYFAQILPILGGGAVWFNIFRRCQYADCKSLFHQYVSTHASGKEAETSVSQ
jgi:F0F1-type ATP synthase assembly protein I